MRSWGLHPQEWDLYTYRRGLRKPDCPFHYVRMQQEAIMCEAEGPHQPQTAGVLTIKFPAPELWGRDFYFYTFLDVRYFVVAAHADKDTALTTITNQSYHTKLLSYLPHTHQVTFQDSSSFLKSLHFNKMKFSFLAQHSRPSKVLP